MSSTAETSHAKNVGNFQSLISFCMGFGPTYNPSKAALTMAQIQAQYTQAKDSLNQSIVTQTSFNIATNNRKTAFSDLKQLATKIINALAVSGASELTLNNAKTVNRKIQGTRAAAINSTPLAGGDTVEALPTIKSISNSQQSFDNRIAHFAKLVEIISQDTFYKPNETNLQIAALQTILNGLNATNKASIMVFTNLSNTRIERNNILYNPTTGLVQTAKEIKKYVKSIFNVNSPQYKQVSSIEFATVKNR